MEISSEDIKNRIARLAYSRSRKLLLRARNANTLTDQHIMEIMAPGLWRTFGYRRLEDYLNQELRLPQDRIRTLVQYALKGGYERAE